MFSKSITSLLVLSLALHVSGHALIAPMLGVARNAPVRDDVQRTSNEKPCGEVDIARTIDTSNTVELARDGTFNVTVTNFNAYVWSMLVTPIRLLIADHVSQR